MIEQMILQRQGQADFRETQSLRKKETHDSCAIIARSEPTASLYDLKHTDVAIQKCEQRPVEMPNGQKSAPLFRVFHFLARCLFAAVFVERPGNQLFLSMRAGKSVENHPLCPFLEASCEQKAS